MILALAHQIREYRNDVIHENLMTAGLIFTNASAEYRCTCDGCRTNGD